MVQHPKMFLLSVYTLLIAFNCQVSAKVFATTPGYPNAETSPAPRSVWDVLLGDNRPAVGTIRPFVSTPAPSQQYLECFRSCPPTAQYKPICGSDMQLYQNEQKFNCARSCGANIKIFRRGSCEDFFIPTQF